ncbi:hypothetical protein Q9L58_010883, partial [Maublancomyces gigas]
MSLTNVCFTGPVDRALMPKLFQIVDLLLVTLRNEPTLCLTIPSKIQAYLQAGRPIVGALNGEGARIIGLSGSGMTVAAEDEIGLANLILTLYLMPAIRRETMGTAGKAYFDSHFEVNGLVNKLNERNCRLMKPKVLILGASGMLGSAVFRGFLQSADYGVTATIRSPESARFFSDRERSYLATNVDVLDGDSLVSLLAKLRPDIVVNCIGLIKQLSSAKDPLVALPINSLFPHKLARLCALSKTRLVHISTDCVFTGSKGLYSEDSVPDATDLYGLSKYLGEVVDYENAVTLRTSIIGRELNTANSLVDWFLGQAGAVKGFTKAIFSGLPT